MTTQSRPYAAFALLLALVLPLANIVFAEPTTELSRVAGDLGKPSQPELGWLSLSDKVHHSDDILDGLLAGELETRIIVTLRAPQEVFELANLSQWSTARPEVFRRTGAPTFFNLRNEGIRERLRKSVTRTVGDFIGRLGARGIAITQRFAYQPGLAAQVTEEGLERLLKDPDVLRIEPDRLLEAHTDQGISVMDGIQPSTDYDGSGLSIAICDTGIDTSHPMLGDGGAAIFNAKVIGGYDTGDNDNDPRPNGEAHGTACAGIAAGEVPPTAQGDYIGGVAPGAKLYSIKISQGSTGSAYTSAMIAGWEWAIDHQNDDPNNPIRIISTSFGGGRYFSACDNAVPSMTAAAANALAAGISIFASSGNEGYCDSLAWPACISYVNSVGAVYDADIGSVGWCVDSSSCASAEPGYSCGSGGLIPSFDDSAADKVTVYSNSAPFLTLLAPSNDASTTDIVGGGGYSANDYYSQFGGTSAASPYAAGAAAVLQSAAKAITGDFVTPSEVRALLTGEGDLISDDKVPTIVKPRINLANAVGALPGDQSKTLTSLAIDGPDVVNEGESTSYTATASYSDSSTAPVAPTWSENSDFASVDTNGLLTAGAVTSNQTATLSASYSEGGVTEAVDKTVTIVDIGSPSEPVVVFADSFEDGQWNGKWSEDSQNDWRTSTQRAADGRYSAEVDGRASDAELVSVPIDPQGATSATIQFGWYIEKGLDQGEYLAFDLSTDGGGSWQERARLNGNVDTENQWHEELIDVSGLAADARLRLRFRGRMSGAAEDADVDTVRVTAPAQSAQ